METRETRDIVSGLVLLAIGLFVAWYAGNYRFGSLARIGPGFAPLVLGVALAGLGTLIAIGGVLSLGKPAPKFEARPFFAILMSVAAFAVTVRAFGLVPATVLLTGVAALADKPVRPGKVVLLATGLSLVGYGIFTLTLRLPIAPFSRRFLDLIGLG